MAKSAHQFRGSRRSGRECADPVIGDILAGWRYDISGVSPAMRVDYDHHLSDCAYCRHRQRLARTIDLLLLAVTALSIVAFVLAAAVLHRIDMIAHLDLHGHLHHSTVTISLQAVAIAGVLVSVLLCLLVAVSTPIPSLVSSVLQERLPENIRERFSRDAA